MKSVIDLMTIAEASEWATAHLNKQVTPSNISYLVQYGRVRKYTQDGVTKVARAELERYYQAFLGRRETSWKTALGDDVNWHLSFDFLKESDTTKHVHRLHPYKGKFIPQLVAYFLDSHVDEFKKQAYFKPGDLVLDPFCGSGTTLVQANELGIHAIGVDISAFNALISNIKVEKHDLVDVQREILRITRNLRTFLADSRVPIFERELQNRLAELNNRYFPSPEFKIRVQRSEVNEDLYGKEKETEFLTTYWDLVKQYDVDLIQPTGISFLDVWYLPTIRREIDVVMRAFEQVANPTTRRILQIILSRTIRSCRATTHADLGTLIEPVRAPYYCAKHGKVCKPLFSMLSWWERYSKDTIERLHQFSKLRTNTLQFCVSADSTNVDLFGVLENQSPALAQLVSTQKIKGIFSSPPYVGLIDYHEQHAYAYELFGFDRNDSLEIGAMQRGQGREARRMYVDGIAAVLNNAKRWFVEDYDVFLVANDKYNMYPQIAERAGMKIVNQFKRPVLNRTERDKSAYAEIIFHLKAR